MCLRVGRAKCQVHNKERQVITRIRGFNRAFAVVDDLAFTPAQSEYAIAVADIPTELATKNPERTPIDEEPKAATVASPVVHPAVSSEAEIRTLFRSLDKDTIQVLVASGKTIEELTELAKAGTLKTIPQVGDGRSKKITTILLPPR